MRWLMTVLSLVLLAGLLYWFYTYAKRDGISPVADVPVVYESTFETTERAPETEEKSSLPVIGQAPELIGLTDWINSEPITSLEELRGQVVLIDFWTFGCINCQRTFPHVTDLYEKYHDQGFEILGLHTPEFAYERKLASVQAAVQKHGLTYPIALDNDFATWRNYNNRYWPAHYLIDKQGRIRYTHFGEGQYAQMDENVAALLAE